MINIYRCPIIQNSSFVKRIRNVSILGLCLAGQVSCDSKDKEDKAFLNQVCVSYDMGEMIECGEKYQPVGANEELFQSGFGGYIRYCKSAKVSEELGFVVRAEEGPCPSESTFLGTCEFEIDDLGHRYYYYENPSNDELPDPLDQLVEKEQECITGTYLNADREIVESSGVFTRSDRFSPRPTLINPMMNVVDIQIAGDSICVLRADGRVWCRGENEDGQLGLGDHDRGLHPWFEPVPDLFDVLQIYGSGFGKTYFAIQSNGTLLSWGRIVPPSLEPLEVDGNIVVPTAIPGLPPIRTIASDAFQICALGTDTSLWCWSGNEDPHEVTFSENVVDLFRGHVKLESGRWMDWNGEDSIFPMSVQPVSSTCYVSSDSKLYCLKARLGPPWEFELIHDFPNIVDGGDDWVFLQDHTVWMNRNYPGKVGDAFELIYSNVYKYPRSTGCVIYKDSSLWCPSNNRKSVKFPDLVPIYERERF